jgi:hypothetical protein
MGLRYESESLRSLAQREHVRNQIRDEEAFLSEQIDGFADIARAPAVRRGERDFLSPKLVERDVYFRCRIDRREE